MSESPQEQAPLKGYFNKTLFLHRESFRSKHKRMPTTNHQDVDFRSYVVYQKVNGNYAICTEVSSQESSEKADAICLGEVTTCLIWTGQSPTAEGMLDPIKLTAAWNEIGFDQYTLTPVK